MAAGDYPLLPSEVRTYIHDFADQNHLIDGEEFSDEAIELAMRMAVGDYNLMPPLERLEPKQFPSAASDALNAAVRAELAELVAKLLRRTAPATSGAA